MKVIEFRSCVTTATGDSLLVSISAQVAASVCYDWLDEFWSDDFAEIVWIRDRDGQELILDFETENELLQQAIDIFYEAKFEKQEMLAAIKEDQSESFEAHSSSIYSLIKTDTNEKYFERA